MENAINELLKFFPPDVQAILRNPPSLSTPSSFMPALRLVSNWGYILIVLVAFYVVWTVVSGFVGTFYRFFRFWAKLAPVIGVIGWVMSQSGHGSLPEVFDLVKQWTGIGGTTNTGAGGQGQAPGIAQLAGMFGLGGDANANTNKRSTKRTTRSSTKNKKAADSGPGLGDLADILKSATGSGNTGAGLGAGIGEGGEWQDVVQGYVKNAVLKASGLDWLFGQGQAEKAEEKRRTR